MGTGLMKFTSNKVSILYWIIAIYFNVLDIAKAAAPTFTSPTITIDLLENVIIGSPVTFLGANDADGDIISYTHVSIDPSDADDIFNVAVTGEITTRVALDYETQTSYVLVVRATSNSEAAEQTIYVTIINVNEAPVFPSVLYGVTADDGSANGDLVTIIEAEDPDLTTDTKYTITDGNTEGHFAIGQTSGLLSVSPGNELNRTIISAYALTIEAADNGQPPKTGTTTLVIGICNGSASFGTHYLTSIVFSIYLVLNMSY